MISNEISQKIIDEGNFVKVFHDLLGNISFALPIPGFVSSTNKDPNYEEEFTDFEWDMYTDAWERYVKLKLKEDVQKYRTKNSAGEVVEVSSSMPIITNPNYQNAMTLNQDKNAHLQQINSDVVNNLKFEDGKLYFKGHVASAVSLVGKFTNENLSDIDLPLMRTLYGIILKNIKINPESLLNRKSRGNALGYTVHIYLPDFLSMIGLDPKINKASIAYAVEKVSSFNRILGIMKEYSPAHGKTFKAIYPVMLFMGYEEKNNTIHFASPYMNVLIWEVLQASIRKDSKGNPRLNKKGEPLMLPAHSFLIKNSLAKERNVRAAEIVCIVVALIEQAGNNTPHIKASTIIERHPALKQALDETKTASNKNNILKRAFSTAWKYLKEDTILAGYYKNIQLPPPDKYPTMSTLDMVFEFPHEGKLTSKKYTVENLKH